MSYRLGLGSYTLSGIQPKGEYPYMNAIQSESGHFIIMDDTPDNEYLRIQHNRSNTWITMLPNDDMDVVIGGNSFTVVINNNDVNIQGVCNINVGADCKLSVSGSVFAQIGENLQAKVDGGVSVVAAGEVKVTSGGDVSIQAGGPTSLLPPNITLSTPGTVKINSDLIVSGYIQAGNDISATGHLTAGKKLWSVMGMETIGGINCGFWTGTPVPPGLITTIPSGVVTTGIVNASAFYGLVSAVVIDSAVMQIDFLDAMAMVRMFYNMHRHTAPATGGVTSPTLLPDGGVGPQVTGAPTVTF